MMTKPNFNMMSRQDLRAYVLANRDDDAAIEALIRRGNGNTPTYPFPKTAEDLQQMAVILKQKLEDTNAA